MERSSSQSSSRSSSSSSSSEGEEELQQEVEEPDLKRSRGKRERASVEEEDVEDDEDEDHKEQPGSGAPLRTKEEYDDKKTVFAGGLPLQANADDIRTFFSEAGTVNRLRLLQYQGKSNGAAFVEFVSQEDARNALSLDGAQFLRRTVRVNLATAKPNRKGLSVYVGNLPFTATEKTLRSIFSNCGEIVRFKMPLFRDSGRLRGFAIIDLDTEAARERAVQLNGMKLEGRELRIEVMQKQEKVAKRVPPSRRRDQKKKGGEQNDRNKRAKKEKRTGKSAGKK